MPVIKRYPNRKMYDTEAKQYITLEGIAALIRQGKEISVIDHATGEDLTAVTLSQIIFEQEKKQRGFLPRAVLRGLIQAGGDTLGTLRHTLATPLGLESGAFNSSRLCEEELERVLIEMGVPTRDELQVLMEQLDALAQKLDEISQEQE